MLKNTYLKTLRDYKFSLIFWTIGLILVPLFYISIFPSIKDSSVDFDQYLKTLPDSIKSLIGNASITTPAGYLGAEIFSITGPLVFAVFAIGFGSGAVAGEENKGYLDVLLSYPLKRWQFLIYKALGMVSLVFILGLILWLSLFMGTSLVGMDLSLTHLFAAVFSLCFLGLFFGSLALAAGAVTGKRGLAIGITAMIGILGYILNTIGTTVEFLKPYQKVSPFYYYNSNSPLLNGLNFTNILVLAALATILIGVGIYFFDKRDLGK